MYLSVPTRTGIGRLKETLGNLQLESHRLPLSFLLPILSLARTVQSNTPLHFKLSFKQELIK